VEYLLRRTKKTVEVWENESVRGVMVSDEEWRTCGGLGWVAKGGKSRKGNLKD
jgi:hypothetical protein